MERMKRWMGSAALVAAMAASAAAADKAGLMLKNAEHATGIFQTGLGSGVSAEDTAARGFEGQQALLGFGSGAGETGGVDASGAKSTSGFAKFAQRRPAAGLKADTAVPSPVGYDCRGPGCGSNGGDKGRTWGANIGRVAGFVLGFVALAAAVVSIFSGNVMGIALGAAAIAGSVNGRPQGDSFLERFASSPLSNGLARVGGFVGEWTGRGASKAAGFVKGLFHRG